MKFIGSESDTEVSMSGTNSPCVPVPVEDMRVSWDINRRDSRVVTLH